MKWPMRLYRPRSSLAGDAVLFGGRIMAIAWPGTNQCLRSYRRQLYFQPEAPCCWDEVEEPRNAVEWHSLCPQEGIMQIQINSDDHVHGSAALSASVSAAIQSDWPVRRPCHPCRSASERRKRREGRPAGQAMHDRGAGRRAQARGGGRTGCNHEAGAARRHRQTRASARRYFGRLDDHRRNLSDQPPPDTDPTRTEVASLKNAVRPVTTDLAGDRASPESRTLPPSWPRA